MKKIIIIFTLLLIVEGMASYYLSFYESFSPNRDPSEQHTQYDADLGWVNIPNIHLDNFYGAGRTLKVNSMGFRSDKEFTPHLPSNKLRIVASGDSFTLGFGVGNPDTWCQKISEFDPQFEVVNMGQGGYGIDQAYLWFKRDHKKVNFHIHLFAMISDDFRRMSVTAGKPYFRIKEDRLILHNIPVAKLTGESFSKKVGASLHRLNLFTIIRKFRSLKQAAPSSKTSNELPPELVQVSSKIFSDLLQLNKENKSIFLLVYLPQEFEVKLNFINPWRKFVAEESKRRNYHLIDLTDDFKKEARDDVDSYFIKKGDMNFPHAEGHYNEKGNELVSKLLLKRLKEVPQIIKLISQ